MILDSQLNYLIALITLIFWNDSSIIASMLMVISCWQPWIKLRSFWSWRTSNGLWYICTVWSTIFDNSSLPLQSLGLLHFHELHFWGFHLQQLDNYYSTYYYEKLKVELNTMRIICLLLELLLSIRGCWFIKLLDAKALIWTLAVV